LLHPGDIALFAGDNITMTPARIFIGIDGCRAGWFCVLLDQGDNWSCRVAPDASAVGKLAMAADSVLIDIPIGLPDAGPDGRLCDREARRMLGRGRASSVFSAPARGTLAATGYPLALELNRAATGRGLSRQAWNIVPKIREIDTLLCNNRSLQGVMRESHPELCFWALNGRQAMRYNKKHQEGRQERLHVLQGAFPHCHALFEQACARYPRREVARDDIIDAMVCAVTAKQGDGHYQAVLATPARDGQGLAMEIVYPRSATMLR
jgi:predicted RNase H-like nuclease